MKFQTILLVAAALMITYVRAAPIDIVEQPDVNPDDQKAKCGYDMIICCPCRSLPDMKQISLRLADPRGSHTVTGPQRTLSMFSIKTNKKVASSATRSQSQDQSSRPLKESARPLVDHKPILTPDEAAHFILKKNMSKGINILGTH
ncbi:hypothetical protein BGZ82_002282 [Podila clonocystis]|nr:hypothetical protein BGZ82_002282 [Podila clonocystis]